MEPLGKGLLSYLFKSQIETYTGFVLARIVSGVLVSANQASCLEMQARVEPCGTRSPRCLYNPHIAY